METARILSVLLLIPLCGLEDRWIGSGDKWPGTPRRGRTPAFLAALAGFLAVALAMGLPTVQWPWRPDTPGSAFAKAYAPTLMFALSFLMWRCAFGWRAFGGSMVPTRAQIPGTFVRHAVSLFYLLPAAAWGLSLIWVGAWMLIFAALATNLALYNAENYVSDFGNRQAFVESVRGHVHGICVAVAFAGGAILLQLGVHLP